MTKFEVLGLVKNMKKTCYRVRRIFGLLSAYFLFVTVALGMDGRFASKGPGFGGLCSDVVNVIGAFCNSRDFWNLGYANKHLHKVVFDKSCHRGWFPCVEFDQDHLLHLFSDPKRFDKRLGFYRSFYGSKRKLRCNFSRPDFKKLVEKNREIKTKFFEKFLKFFIKNIVALDISDSGLQTEANFQLLEGSLKLRELTFGGDNFSLGCGDSYGDTEKERQSRILQRVVMIPNVRSVVVKSFEPIKKICKEGKVLVEASNDMKTDFLERLEELHFVNCRKRKCVPDEYGTIRENHFQYLSKFKKLEKVFIVITQCVSCHSSKAT